MIEVPVDEAHAFDMLCVLFLKKNRSHIDNEAYHTFYDMLEDKLGYKLVNTIVVESDEYKTLLSINNVIFDLLDDIDNGKDYPAAFIHLCNQDRFKAKKALQEKFFGTLTEHKFHAGVA